MFKYICNNCGRLLVGDCRCARSPAFDVKALGLACPPEFDVFESIGELSYSTSKWSWTTCSTRGTSPVDVYNTCDPHTGKLLFLQLWKARASPYEKRQIALTWLISKLVTSCSDKLKIWEHIQWQIQTRSRLDYHYFGKHGFMVGKENQPICDKVDETSIELQLHIKWALFWLRDDNPLYQKF